MKVQFEEMFPWEFAKAIAEAPICYLPLGALEWHGEHNAVGLDSLKAVAICIRAAQQSGGMCPAACSGSALKRFAICRLTSKRRYGEADSWSLWS
jgi:creatinine amidohydrolase/Fe(II)-dependent formamide hydrolase-like protein